MIDLVVTAQNITLGVLTLITLANFSGSFTSKNVFLEVCWLELIASANSSYCSVQDIHCDGQSGNWDNVWKSFQCSCMMGPWHDTRTVWENKIWSWKHSWHDNMLNNSTSNVCGQTVVGNWQSPTCQRPGRTQRTGEEFAEEDGTPWKYWFWWTKCNEWYQ